MPLSPGHSTFEPFSLLHALSLVWTLGLIAGSCWLGRRWLKRGDITSERTLAGAWGGFVIGVNVWSLVYWFLPANFSLKNGMPLQLCDLACLLTPLAFLTSWRWPRVMVYFWGLGLSSQAFITPTLRDGPGDMMYWLFWLVHLAIVGSCVYDMIVRAFRPTLRDLLFAVAVSLVYLTLVITINTALDANYGYVGKSSPENSTLIDHLGPWPLRIVFMASLGIAWLCVLWAIWKIPAAVSRLQNSSV
jgi:hypothetical integral membrane protein (TIGR02206 family)